MEAVEEIDRIERVKPRLADLGDVAICDRRLADLRARYDALAAATAA